MTGFYSFDWLFFVGTVSFTITGYLTGVKKHCDLLGVAILALLTAVGGGLVCDVLLNRLPRVFLDMSPGYGIFGTLLLAWAFSVWRWNAGVLHQLFIVSDAIGLAAFSIAGAQLGLALHINLFGVCALAFVTAVGGGLLRDMLVNEVPFVLHKDFYGTIPILIAIVLFTLHAAGVDSLAVQWTVFWSGLALRLVAYRHALQLPRMR